ncbi:MAG: histidine phosphatase family protein, partial [Clostridia bacterium]|nr:histidine phosphatase family protein [Clostridia bacterium]
EANRNNIFAGQIDPDLQDKGLEQAKATAKFINETYEVDKIYSSDLKRAYNTARALADILNIEIIKEKGMREIAAGEWEGILFSDLVKLFPDDFNKWMTSIGEARCTGGETVKELAERVVATLTKIAEESDGKTVAVATHATPIRVALAVIKTGSVDGANEVGWVSNASVTELTYENGKFKVEAEGQDEHLKALVTKLPDNV